MEQPSRTPVPVKDSTLSAQPAEGNGQHAGTGSVASQGTSAERLSIADAARLLGQAPRTIYDDCRQHKLRCVREPYGPSRERVWTTRAWVADFQRTRQLARHPLDALDAPVLAPAWAALVDGSLADQDEDQRAARRYLGEGPEASEDAVTRLAAALGDTRWLLLRLQVQTRVHFLQDFFQRVREATQHLEQLGPGIIAALLLLASLASLGAQVALVGD